MQSNEVNWRAIQESPRFRDLVRRRRNTIVGLGIAAAIYYFSIPALIGWAPAVFNIRLAPGINLGLLFAVSQYPFGGLIAYLFLRRMSAIDPLARELATQAGATAVEKRNA